MTARNTVVVHRAEPTTTPRLVETNRGPPPASPDAARRRRRRVGFGGDGTVAGGHGIAARPRWAPAGRLDQRLRPRSGCPTTRRRRRSARRGIDAGDFPRSGWARSTGGSSANTGVGYDAAVVATVEKRASWKRWFGHPLFITAALTTWLAGYDRHTPHFRVKTGNRTIEDGYFTIVMNTNPYTYLGNRPLDLSHAATFDRGLVVLTFRTMRARTILSSLAGALRGGGVKPNALLDEQTDVEHLVIEHETAFPYQLDGDYLGETERLEFQHVPDAIKLVMPR